MKAFLPNRGFFFPEGSVKRFKPGVLSQIEDAEAELLCAKGLGTIESAQEPQAAPESSNQSDAVPEASN